ncbi:MAG: chromosomal replication initiator protein DnaA [Pirellulales bacterium]|nr:chromosomal replication initiator protein DnaA [Pirellulales bacterium]
MDDKEIVLAVRTLLADKVERDDFELWFGAETKLELTDGIFRVTAISRFVQDWLRIHFRGAIETACRHVLGRSAAVEFHVADASLPTDSALPEVRQTQLPFAGSSEPAANSVLVTHHRNHAGVAPAPSTTAAMGNRWRRTSRRGHLAVTAAQGENLTTGSRRRFAKLDSFVVGSSNRLAHAMAQTAVEKPGSMSPLLFHGPSGCGKTHLLEAIWTAAHALRRSANVVFLSAEQFTTLFVEALRGAGLPSFRRKYRGVDLLIVDDVQFLEGKRATLVELLHTIDALHRDGKQLVFSADRSPAALGELGPELASRLAGGMTCSLEQPDLSLRIGLVQQFASRLDVEFPPAVAEYIAANVTTGAREISGAVNRIHAASRMLKEPISHELAEVSLAELLRHSRKAVRLTDIERAICDEFGLSNESLQSGGRTKAISSARMLAMFLARKHTRAGLAEIGQHFGRRSHSTVISAQKRVSDWLSNQSDIDLSERRCTVDEAIQRVEQRLRAG